MQPMVFVSHARTVSPKLGIWSFSVRDCCRLTASPVFSGTPPIFREEASFRCVKEHFSRDARFITPISRRTQHFCAFVYVSANSPIVSKSILRDARLIALIFTRVSCEKVLHYLFNEVCSIRFLPLIEITKTLLEKKN